MVDTHENIYLKQLENRVVQDEVFDLLRVRNPFFVFEKAGQVELFADRAMFIGTQPAEGEDYRREMKDAQDPLVFSHELGLVLKRRYSSVTNRDIEKMALETPEKLTELFAQIIKDITNRAHYELLTKCVELICEDSNYNTNALIKKPLDEFRKPAQILRWLNDARAFMCSPSKNYNKGFKATANFKHKNSDGTETDIAAGTFVPVLASAYDPLELVFITDPSVYNVMEEEIFSQRFHYDLSQLEKKFGLVIQVPLTITSGGKAGEYFQFVIISRNAFALRYVIRKGIESKYYEENMQTSFFLHNWIIAGSIPFENQAAWRVENKASV